MRKQNHAFVGCNCRAIISRDDEYSIRSAPLHCRMGPSDPVSTARSTPTAASSHRPTYHIHTLLLASPTLACSIINETYDDGVVPKADLPEPCALFSQHPLMAVIPSLFLLRASARHRCTEDPRREQCKI
jgi:hypothetical protein